jgi:hypothetical protein
MTKCGPSIGVDQDGEAPLGFLPALVRALGAQGAVLALAGIAEPDARLAE